MNPIKRTSLVAFAWIAATCVTRAANIVWVSDLVEANTATGNDPDGPYPDQGYIALLTAAGHTVTRYNPPDAGAISGTDIAMLNASSLVILGRGVGSGAFDVAEETLPWNTLVTKPLMSTNAFLTRNSRLGWFAGATTVDTATTTATTAFTFANLVNPVTAYIIGGVNMTGSTTTNPMYVDVTSQVGAGTSLGVSLTTDALVAGGTLIATTNIPVNGVAIASFPAGTALTGALNAGQSLAGYRMVFSTGNREPVAPNNQLGRAGYEDLTPDAEGMFLRAVTVAINSGAVPEPSTAMLLPIGVFSLLRRRRESQSAKG